MPILKWLTNGVCRQIKGAKQDLLGPLCVGWLGLRCKFLAQISPFLVTLIRTPVFLSVEISHLVRGVFSLGPGVMGRTQWVRCLG